MEKQQKTYQCLGYVQLDTYVMVNGVKTLIAFRGGTLEPRRHGTFTTTDPSVIAAMDKDSGNGTSFKCVHSDVILDDDDKGPGKDDSSFKQVTGVKTVAAAREYLVNASENGEIKEGITTSMIKNRTQVLEIAREAGIKFVDLPTE